eukprot:CAMPEP_0170105322 /NCGR_PEP_ID=MMETSP0020_2-20130122/4693_1 /TAXON_ID=98059 /ORGANISM="Dinobryon sp., Strain UTEXLB2267" /LENGTH=819 /DNA_ID=CAMNT_0010329403 /DNA_START=951 /DNA_END=3406 /DNA_ORIENTATION=-
MKTRNYPYLTIIFETFFSILKSITNAIVGTTALRIQDDTVHRNIIEASNYGMLHRYHASIEASGGRQNHLNRLYKILSVEDKEPPIICKENSLVIEATEKSAWTAGQTRFDDFKLREGIVFDKELVSQVVTGLLYLAKEIPTVGPVAGIMLGFYEGYQCLSRNKEEFKDLVEEVDLTATVISDPRLRNIIRISQDDKLLIACIKQFTKSVYDIYALMKDIENRKLSKEVVDHAKNFIMAGKDKERIQVAITKSRNTRIEIMAILAAKSALDENSYNSMLSKVNECLSKPGTFDDMAKGQQKKFQEGSRSWLFEEVDAWFDDREIVPTVSTSWSFSTTSKKSSKSVFWLQAGAGMGKTVFASELVRRFREKRPGVLLGAVFFNFKVISTQGPTTLLKSIAYQIAKSCPSICSDLLNVLKEKNETCVEGIFDMILLKALELVVMKQPSQNHLIIFDALDECGLEGSDARRDLLQLFHRDFLRKLPAGVKLFVTGRPEKDLEITFNAFAHTIKDTDPRHLEDLKKFIMSSVDNMADHLKAVTSFSIQQATDLIYEKSEGKFIYTAVVVEQMREWFEEDQHDLSFQENLEKLPQGLDGCYGKTVNKIIGGNPEYARNFLLLMVGCREPLSEATVKELLKILNSQQFTFLKERTTPVFPLVYVGEKTPRFVPYHKSIVDWLTSINRNGDSMFLDGEEASWFIADKLLKKVGVSLRGKSIDMGDVQTVQTLEHLAISILELSKEEDHTLLYAVRHLTFHLNSCQLGLVTYFLMTNLTWLQMSLQAMGLALLLESYSKLLQNDEWLPETCYRGDLMKDVKLMSQFL